MTHTFHIPVLGLAFSIDTPLKVARYGISSVVSIVDDMLIERMRKFHAEKHGKAFSPIHPKEQDRRARRITAYLNQLQELVDEQFAELREQAFDAGSDICRYFKLLPENSLLKQKYRGMLVMTDGAEKLKLQQELRAAMVKGSIDVNIMSKVDRLNPGDDDERNSDALAALRGFANSSLNASLILSAGMNPRLYSYLENFTNFLPDETGAFEKRIVLKVSDFRSALIQAKFLAKKGLWVSEFRIESGLNCGGHAFATEGFLMGPILEEFKEKRVEMRQELFEIYQKALAAKGVVNCKMPALKISVQGGIGTAAEDQFLLNYYNMDATGWGSPFLLVPEASNVDEDTLNELASAGHDDFYISGSSPLGVPFNNFRKSSSERQRLERIARERPGSPCTKKYLATDTEFTDEPICTASREYQNLKLKQLNAMDLDPELHALQFSRITEKACLCQGLATSAYLKNDILKPRENKAVSICPGPNIAWFKGPYTLDEMIGHIYGRLDLLTNTERPNMFVNELNLYVEYLKKDISMHLHDLNEKKTKYWAKFKNNLLQGIDYYKQLLPRINNQSEYYRQVMLKALCESEQQLALLNNL